MLGLFRIRLIVPQDDDDGDEEEDVVCDAIKDDPLLGDVFSSTGKGICLSTSVLEAS